MSSNPTSTSTPRAPRRSPLRTRRGRAGLAGSAVLLAALPLLSACAAGGDPEVYKIVPDNGNGKSGYMYVSNVWVVFDQTTGNAEVVGQVANTDPSRADSNRLTQVTVSGAAAMITAPADTTDLAPGVQVAGGAVTIPGLQSVQFGEPGQPEIALPSADLTTGANANVTYTFSSGDSVTVTAIVEPNSGQWAHYNPNGQNTGTPTPAASVPTTGTASPGGTATATATGSASAPAAGASGTASAGASSSAKPSATATH